MSRQSGLGQTIVTLWPSASSCPLQVLGRGIIYLVHYYVNTVNNILTPISSFLGKRGMNEWTLDLRKFRHCSTVTTETTWYTET